MAVGALKKRPVEPADPLGGLADEAGQLWLRVRRRMMLLIVGLAGSVGLLGVLDRAGLIQGFLDPSNPLAFQWSDGALVTGMVTLAGYVHHRRHAGEFAPRIVAFTVTVLTVFLIPSPFVGGSFLQVIWLPAFCAMVLLDVRWLVIVLGFELVLLVAVHGAPPTLRPGAVLVSFFIASAMLTFRGLVEQSLAIASRERNRFLLLSLHDPLTRLPNRRLLEDRIAEALKRAKRSGLKVGIIFVDLDHFSRINDSLGHDVGDELLTKVAALLSGAVRDTDTVARFGGDEFVVLLPEIPSVDIVERVAREMQQSLNKSIVLKQNAVSVSGSFGAACFPADGQTTTELLRSADQALYESKRAGRNEVRFSTVEAQQRADLHFQLSQDLRSALEQEQLSLVYQPIVDLKTKRVERAEALLRWSHPSRGMVSPSLFVPLAESNGEIHDIGHWVLQAAAFQALNWRSRGASDFRVSFNCSPVQFRRAGFEAPCLDLLRDHEIPPSLLTLELTESLLIDGDPATQGSLNSLREAGLRLSLDDFGTGYSSLSHLHRFELDEVKLDRSLVADLQRGAASEQVCRGIVAMAHALGLRVVAEGIETLTQQRLLSEMGCDYGQGYLFGYPMPSEEFHSYWLDASESN